MRTIPVRATGFSPYILVYKQSPIVPIPAALGPYEEDELESLSEAQLTELTTSFKLLAEEVQQRQHIYDRRMTDAYKLRRDVAEYDIRHIFEAGDQVMLR